MPFDFAQGKRLRFAGLAAAVAITAACSFNVAGSGDGPGANAIERRAHPTTRRT